MATPELQVRTAARGNSLLESDVLTVLPRTTEMLLVLRGPTALSTRLGLSALQQRHAALLDPIRAESVAAFGVDLLDAEQWPSAGLDPDRPMGVALLDRQARITCFFAGLGDRGRLEQLITRRATKIELPLHREPVGGAIVWTTPTDSQAAIVLQGAHAMLVFGAGAPIAARELAVISIGASLDRDPELRSSAAKLTNPTDVALYATGPALALMLRGSRENEPRNRHALVDAVRSVALGASVERGPIALHGFISADARSLPLAMAGLDAPALTGAPIELSISLRHEHLGELFRSLVGWGGRPERASEELTRMLGVDPARELLSAMTGRGRLAVRGRPVIPPASVVEAHKQFDITVATELIDTANGEALAPRLRGEMTSRADLDVHGRWLSATWTDGEKGLGGSAPAQDRTPASPAPAFLRAHIDLAMLAYLDMPLSYPSDMPPLDPSSSSHPRVRQQLEGLANIEDELRAAWRQAERMDAAQVLASYRALGTVTFTAVPDDHGFDLLGELRPPAGDLPKALDRLLLIRRQQAEALELQMDDIKTLEARRIELRRRIEEEGSFR